MRLCRRDTQALASWNHIYVPFDGAVIHKYIFILARNENVHPLSKRGGTEDVTVTAAVIAVAAVTAAAAEY